MIRGTIRIGDVRGTVFDETQKIVLYPWVYDDGQMEWHFWVFQAGPNNPNTRLEPDHKYHIKDGDPPSWSGPFEEAKDDIRSYLLGCEVTEELADAALKSAEGINTAIKAVLSAVPTRS